MFEFDQKKSESNKLLHGADFVEAQAIWEDPHMIVGPADSTTEERWAAVGAMGKKMWFVAFTMRNLTVRIITCRPARDYERQAYEDSKD